MIYEIVKEETLYVKDHYGTERKTRIERTSCPSR